MSGAFGKTLFAGLVTAASLLQAGVETGTPVLKDTAISCLNKVVSLNPANGQFSIQVDGETVVGSYVCYSVRLPGDPNPHWNVPGSQHSPEYVKGGAKWTKTGERTFVFEQPMKVGDVTWTQYRIEFELMTNGLVRVTHCGRACPDPSLAEVAYSSFFVSCGEVVSRDMKYTCASNSLDFTLFAGDPAREIRFSARREDGVTSRSVKMNAKGKVEALLSSKDGVPKTFYIDIRRGVRPVRSSETRGGVDFLKVEKLEMPEIPAKNFALNSSFETDLRGWSLRLGFCGRIVDPQRYSTPWFARDTAEKVHGRYSLKCFAHHEPKGLRMDNRQLERGVNVFSMPNVTDAGTYTVSFWAKASREHVGIWVWNPSMRYTKDYKRNTAYLPKTAKASQGFALTTEWARYSYTFEQPLPDPLGVAFNLRCTDGEGWAWIDAIQIEKGERATDYEPPVAEAQLVTSDPLDFIPAGRPLDAKLEIQTAPGASGTVKVEAKGFRGERIAADTLRFAAAATGLATVKLPWRAETFGRGLFMVRYEFSVGGRKHVQHDRFAVVRPIDKSKKWSGRFANLYGNESYFVRAPQLFRRYEQVGLDGSYHVHVGSDNRWVYRETRHDPGVGQMCGPVQGGKWGIAEGTNVLIRSHKDEGVPLDDAYLARFREAVRRRVAAHPDVWGWEFANEFKSFCNNGWWNDEHDDVKRAQDYAKYLKAFVEGGKQANPSALFMNDAPCNMSAGNGVDETRHVLAACTALGFRLDAVAHHIYRYAPENPDLESDWQSLIDALRENGYPETTPFHFGEGMHWGPYEISAWGLGSSTWGGIPATWSGNQTLSYDLGLTERRSAAWRARTFLVGLRHAPRLLQMNAGNINNFSLDMEMTPRASQLVSATLMDVFGNADFVEDIRFAPYVRAYLFKDDLDRPCAALWCHKEDVDFEREAAPEATIDFAGSLAEVRDLMNRDVPFAASGRMTVPVTSAPRYYIGRPGALAAFRAAFRGATVKGGKLADRYSVWARPSAPDRLACRLTDRISGAVTNRWKTIEPALTADAFRRLELRAVGVDLTAHLALRAPDGATLRTLDWSKYPYLAFPNTLGKPGAGFAAKYRVAWNAKGLFLEVAVDDATFCHVEAGDPADRWDNDCLQVYFDLMANARARDVKGYDQDDAEFMVLPAADGRSARAWRVRGCDQQLGLGIHAPKDNAWADDVEVAFERTAKGHVYRVRFPTEALLPATLAKGSPVGLALCVGDANGKEHRRGRFTYRRDGYQTTAAGGSGECWRVPHLYPVMLLWED